jgi:hypothetical protein
VPSVSVPAVYAIISSIVSASGASGALAQLGSTPSTSCVSRHRCRSDHRRRQQPAVVALIVPYRAQEEQDRRAQLDAFVAHQAAFLSQTDVVRFLLVVVEQSDDRRAFNRGQLLNLGFQEAQRCSISAGLHLAAVIFHDVDLLPSDGLLRYYCTPPSAGQPVHISSPSTWSKYDLAGYKEIFFGGVTALHPADFVAANGYPNDFWGWGAEDDQLRLRVGASGGLQRGVVRPPPGAGSYRDLDPVAMLSLLRSRESALAHAHRFNPRMFDQRRRPEKCLDEEWRGANGLRGLRAEVLSRTEQPLACRAPAYRPVKWLHVTARLA